jgi:protein tyrosine phosphatase (PTP) superfamily phosphohydrolase (DUF442 family)
MFKVFARRISLAFIAVITFAAISLYIYFHAHGADLEGFRISGDGIRLARNFNQVGERGEFYRSAQLTESELDDVIRQYGIRTIINLQSSRPGYEWYDGEMREVARRHLVHYDFGLSTETIPKAKDLREILDLLHHAPKPILIHCRSGSDRTGLISAIYAFDFLHESKAQALKEISERYWHVPLLTPAMQYFFNDVYVNEDWAQKEYDECKLGLRYVDRRGCPQ